MLVIQKAGIHAEDQVALSLQTHAFASVQLDDGGNQHALGATLGYVLNTALGDNARFTEKK
jgi:hypothetical protein